MLYQAFLNILINAMQAMPQGGNILVEIKVDRKNIHITVKDEGQGFSKEILQKIWNPFFTTKEKGTGLGLGIVKNIIESHHGQIEVGNREQGGGKITVSLPIN